jgi:hypothetical protein
MHVQGLGRSACSVERVANDAGSWPVWRYAGAERRGYCGRRAAQRASPASSAPTNRDSNAGSQQRQIRCGKALRSNAGCAPVRGATRAPPPPSPALPTPRRAARAPKRAPPPTSRAQARARRCSPAPSARAAQRETERATISSALSQGSHDGRVIGWGLQHRHSRAATMVVRSVGPSTSP